MKYTVTLETNFISEAKCVDCEFRYEVDDVVCRLTKKYLVGFVSDPMCFGGGYRKRMYEGNRPEWCPLEVKK